MNMVKHLDSKIFQVTCLPAFKIYIVEEWIEWIKQCDQKNDWFTSALCTPNLFFSTDIHELFQSTEPCRTSNILKLFFGGGWLLMLWTTTFCQKSRCCRSCAALKQGNMSLRCCAGGGKIGHPATYAITSRREDWCCGWVGRG